MIDEINLDSSNSFAWGEVSSMLPIDTSPHLSVTDNISADLKKYFFHKMEKKGISKAEELFDQYLKAGFLPKAAIALTDRKFFPAPHKSGHGSYLKNVIGDGLFQKEQAARTEAADKSKKHEYTKQMQTGSNPAGQYMLGIGEMALGAGLMIAGAAVEIGSLGTLSVGVAFEEAAALALVADGFARTMNNRDMSFDRNILPAIWKSTDVNTFDGPLYREIDSSLPTNPDDLLKRPGWKETSHPEAGENGHRTFENEETGEKLRHDKGKPWETGYKSNDHWHRYNLNPTGDIDKYLDAQGNPVSNGHPDSHLYPG